MSQDLFEGIVGASDIPTDEESMKARFQEVATNAGVPFNNNADVSPFWRLIQLLVVTPSLWLIGLLTNSVLPNMFVKTATGQWLDILADGVNVQRKEAVKAQGEVTFTRSNTTGSLTIPLGTGVQSQSINGTIYEVVTTESGTFADGVASIRVPVEATEAGSAWNLGAGLYNAFAAPVAGVDTVMNESDWLTLPGADLERDDDLRERTREQFSTANQYHTDAVYRSLISTIEGIESEQIFFDHTAPRGPGSATAYILFDAGVPTSSFIDQVNDLIVTQGNHGLGDDMLAAPMPETLHNVSVRVWAMPTLSSVDALNMVQQIELFIRTAFREATDADYKPTQTQPFSRFSFSRLSQELHTEFPALNSVEFVNKDISSELSIPRLNSLVVGLQ